MARKFRLRLSVPPDAKDPKVRVTVIDADVEEIVATDQGNLMSLVAQQNMVGRIREQLRLDDAEAADLAAQLAGDWLELFKKLQEQQDAPLAQQSAATLLAEMPESVRLEAETLLKDPGLAAAVSADLAALGIAGERELALTLYLTGTSRLLTKPVNARVHGPTSSGKSYVLETVAGLFPDEAVLKATQISPAAFFYLPEGALRNIFVVAGERSRKEDDEAAEKTRALREMMASGHLTKLVPIKTAGGQIETRLVKQPGPISFVETTSLDRVFEEDANRCLTLYTDEQPSQTKEIVKTLAERYQGGGPGGSADAVRQRHHALQRMLLPLEVVVPFAGRLGELLDCRRVELRRGFPQIISLVQAVALLHQHQRDRDETGRVVATRPDYELARSLLVKPMARLLGGGVSDGAIRFHRRLVSYAFTSFTTTQAALKEDCSRTAVRDWLHELADAGCLKLFSPGRGRSPATWEMTEDHPSDGAGVLPTAGQLFSEQGGEGSKVDSGVSNCDNEFVV
jgi:hypothetical protein